MRLREVHSSGFGNREMKPGLTGLFGLNREMGYSRKEFFTKLPNALAGYDFTVDGDEVTVAIDEGTVRLNIGAERERRLSEHVRFPILPVTIECAGVEEARQAKFFQQFERTFFKGLG